MAKKLFELLVNEGQLKQQSLTTRTELKTTFDKKRHLFEEKLVTYVANKEGSTPVVEAQSSIQTNVLSELRWIESMWTKPLDTSFQIAEGNTKARADVTLDNGTVVLAQVPATALLELEKRAGELFDLLKSIPTLDPAKGFSPAPDRGENIFVAREVTKSRTQKVQRPIVLYDATPEHPAQVQLISEDVPVGTIREQEWSGLITPAQKGKLLERAEELRRALKEALHRANDMTVDTTPKCAKKVFDFIIGASA